MVRCHGCYANGWQFNSRLADFLLFFSLLFSRLRLGVTFLQVIVLRLRLGFRLELGFGRLELGLG